jgi:hypothetical protein
VNSIGTSRLQLNEAEDAAILPGLEAIVNALVGARRGLFPRLDPRVQFTGTNGSIVYSQARASEVMASHVLTARNKLKWVNASRKIRLNCFQLAALAFALRMVRKEKLASKEVLAKVAGLANKLERYRKRAMRAAIKQIGVDAYGEQAEIWRRFLQYVHGILCYRPAQRKFSGLRLLHRDQRQKLLELATEVAPTADPALLLHLVDLVKREVLRDRHPVTLGMLVSDDARGLEFMASFLGNHIDPYLLAPEFQSLDIVQSAREEQLKKALVLDQDDDPVDEVQVAGKIVEEPGATTEEPPPRVESLAEAPAAPLASAVTVSTQQELAEQYAEWLLAEVHPADWESITTQTQDEIWRPTRERRPRTVPKIPPGAGAEFRPSCPGPDAFELNNRYADWGAAWLLAGNPSPNTASKAAREGVRIAKEQWDRRGYSGGRDTMMAIYLRDC